MPSQKLLNFLIVASRVSFFQHNYYKVIKRTFMTISGLYFESYAAFRDLVGMHLILLSL